MAGTLVLDLLPSSRYVRSHPAHDAPVTIVGVLVIAGDVVVIIIDAVQKVRRSTEGKAPKRPPPFRLGILRRHRTP